MATIGTVVLLACASDRVTGTRLEHVPNGEWGGPHVQLSVNDQGARIEFDCGHGTLDAPLDLDQQERFDVPGRFVREGGPVREGADDAGQPVRYRGTTDGRELTLEIVFEQGDHGGPYALGLGRSTRLFKCRSPPRAGPRPGLTIAPLVASIALSCD